MAKIVPVTSTENQYDSKCKCCADVVPKGRFVFKYDPYGVQHQPSLYDKNKALNRVFVCETCHEDDSWKPEASAHNAALPMIPWDRSYGVAANMENMRTNAAELDLALLPTTGDVGYAQAAAELKPFKISENWLRTSCSFRRQINGVVNSYISRSDYKAIIAEHAQSKTA